jgi:hypothetical protein
VKKGLVALVLQYKYVLEGSFAGERGQASILLFYWLFILSVIFLKTLSPSAQFCLSVFDFSKNFQDSDPDPNLIQITWIRGHYQVTMFLYLEFLRHYF